MAKGDNPNSRANLKPQNKRTKEEQREIAIKGGKASGKSRGARKTLREELLAMLEDGDTQEKVSIALIKKAMKGDTKAFEVLRDTIGEKPVDKVEQTSTNIVIDFGDIEGDE